MNGLCSGGDWWVLKMQVYIYAKCHVILNMNTDIMIVTIT